MLTLVDLSRSPLAAPYVSEAFVEAVTKTLAEGGRVLVFFNRRGAYRAYVCKDCSHAVPCPRCDLSLAFHSSPSKRLLCHHCGHVEDVPERCPKCGGVNLAGVGVGIQTFEAELLKFFPETPVVRLDSDSARVSKSEAAELKSARIVLSTSLYHRTDPGEFDLVVFPCLDAELVANEYDVEERAYANIRYAAKNAKETLVQTFAPGSPLAKDLSEGTYKHFLERTLSERKRFGYPPYARLARVTVSDRNPDRLKEAVARFANKLEIAKKETGIGSEIFSKTPVFRRADEYVAHIVVKGSDAEELLESLRGEIVKNRNVRLEWR